jgi:hypothetical protein
VFPHLGASLLRLRAHPVHNLQVILQKRQDDMVRLQGSVQEQPFNALKGYDMSLGGLGYAK